MRSNFSVFPELRMNKAKGFIIDLEFIKKENIFQEVLDTLLANKHDPHVGDLVTDSTKCYIFTPNDLLEILLYKDQMILPKYFNPCEYSLDHWSSVLPLLNGYSIDLSSSLVQKSKLCSVIPLKYFGQSHEFFLPEDFNEIRNIIHSTSNNELISKYENLDDEDLVEDFLTYNSLNIFEYFKSIIYIYDSDIGTLVSEFDLNKIKENEFFLIRREKYYQVIDRVPL